QLRPADEASDRELLERYARRRDEAAFAALVDRHGPLVLGVCRRVLPQRHDAEHVFQAAFLVLARKAAGVRWRESVGGWLYQVAYRLARKARAVEHRRRARERLAANAPRPEPAAALTWDEARAVLDEELDRLPEKYRLPLLHCYLEGQTRDQASRRLGWSLRTLDRRLDQAKTLLRHRLTRRGVTLPAALLTAGLAQPATASVPAALLTSTLRSAT